MFKKIKKIFSSHKEVNLNRIESVNKNTTLNSDEVYLDANDLRIIRESEACSREYKRIKGKKILVNPEEIKALYSKMVSLAKNSGNINYVNDPKESVNSYPDNEKPRFNPGLFSDTSNGRKKSLTEFAISEREFELNRTTNPATCTDLGNPNKIIEEYEVDRYQNLGHIIKQNYSSSNFSNYNNPYDEY